MRSIGVTFSMAVAVLVCACYPAPPTVDVAAETAALREAADAYHAAVEGADIEAFVALNANDVLMMPPNSPNTEGSDGARDVVTTYTELPSFQIRFETVTVEVAASGDMGFTLAHAGFSFEGPDGKSTEDHIRDFHLWKKDAAGSWKVAYDIWNSDVPLPADVP